MKVSASKCLLCPLALLLLSLQASTRAQFLFTYEINQEDDSRAPKSSLFDPNDFKIVTPSQLQNSYQKLSSQLVQPTATPPAAESQAQYEPSAPTESSRQSPPASEPQSLLKQTTMALQSFAELFNLGQTSGSSPSPLSSVQSGGQQAADKAVDQQAEARSLHEHWTQQQQRSHQQAPQQQQQQHLAGQQVPSIASAALNSFTTGQPADSQLQLHQHHQVPVHSHQQQPPQASYWLTANPLNSPDGSYLVAIKQDQQDQQSQQQQQQQQQTNLQTQTPASLVENLLSVGRPSKASLAQSSFLSTPTSYYPNPVESSTRASRPMGPTSARQAAPQLDFGSPAYPPPVQQQQQAPRAPAYLHSSTPATSQFGGPQLGQVARELPDTAQLRPPANVPENFVPVSPVSMQATTGGHPHKSAEESLISYRQQQQQQQHEQQNAVLAVQQQLASAHQQRSQHQHSLTTNQIQHQNLHNLQQQQQQATPQQQQQQPAREEQNGHNQPANSLGEIPKVSPRIYESFLLQQRDQHEKHMELLRQQQELNRLLEQKHKQQEGELKRKRKKEAELEREARKKALREQESSKRARAEQEERELRRRRDEEERKRLEERRFRELLEARELERRERAEAAAKAEAEAEERARQRQLAEQEAAKRKQEREREMAELAERRRVAELHATERRAREREAEEAKQASHLRQQEELRKLLELKRKEEEEEEESEQVRRRKQVAGQQREQQPLSRQRARSERLEQEERASPAGSSWGVPIRSRTQWTESASSAAPQLVGLSTSTSTSASSSSSTTTTSTTTSTTSVPPQAGSTSRSSGPEAVRTRPQRTRVVKKQRTIGDERLIRQKIPLYSGPGQYGLYRDSNDSSLASDLAAMLGSLQLNSTSAASGSSSSSPATANSEASTTGSPAEPASTRRAELAPSTASSLLAADTSSSLSPLLNLANSERLGGGPTSELPALLAEPLFDDDVPRRPARELGQSRESQRSPASRASKENKPPAPQAQAQPQPQPHSHHNSSVWSSRSAHIGLASLPPDSDNDGIPGRAGLEYPVLSSVPPTSFSCSKQPLNGYYADTETACQVVHLCQGGAQSSILCPNGTIFNQEKFSCQWWYEVNCSRAPIFYQLNDNLYKSLPTGGESSSQADKSERARKARKEGGRSSNSLAAAAAAA